MRSVEVMAIFLCLLAAEGALEAQVIADCVCENGGICELDASGGRSCSCPDDFIDSTCSKQAVALSELRYSANITQNYSYYYISFNSSTLFYVQIYFCPLQHDPTTVYYAYIDFENVDGSINGHPNSELHSFKTGKNQCVVAKYVLFPYKTKKNGELIRLVVQLKVDAGKANADLEVLSQMQISYNVYEFYKKMDENLGEFMIISIISSAVLFCITFTICRKVMETRMRRFVYHPAQVAHNINSFDVTMPSVFYPPNTQMSEDEKECMICLLNVENTYTRVTACNHLFHKDCIDEWGRKSMTCPACRKSLAPQPRFEI